MSRTLRNRTAAVSALLVMVLAGGCGEKIAIPDIPDFVLSSYVPSGVIEDDDPRQLVAAGQRLFVLTTDALTKRYLNYDESARVEGLADPRAVCVDESAEVVFVWEQGTGTLSWYGFDRLTPLGSTTLPGVVEPVAMATSTRGITLEPGARTFLYLSDPAAGVVHRYAFDDFNGPTSYGILTRAGGEAARFANEPAGLVRDGAGMMLVCDTQPERNWVIRFDSTPDLDDVTADPDDEDPLRGLVQPFYQAACEPAPPAAYVIGSAADCPPDDWVGGPSTEAGEFDAPRAGAVDGAGNIYVADTGNDRFQVFTPVGTYSLRVAMEGMSPVAIGVTDYKYDRDDDDWFYGAEIFVLAEPRVAEGSAPGERVILRYQSYEYYVWDNRAPPPPPE